MTLIATSVVETVRRRLDAELAKINSACTGLEVVETRSIPSHTLQARIRGAASTPRDVDVVLHVRGWSGWSRDFRSIATTIRATVDGGLPDDEMVTDILRQFAFRLEAQRLTAARAAAVGIMRPLEREDWGRIDYLRIDRDALSMLTALKGSETEALGWISDEIRRQRKADEEAGPTPSTSPVTVLDDLVSIGIGLSPVRLQRNTGDDRSEWPVWSGTRISLADTFPDTITHSSAGEPLSRIVAGTVIGHRTMASMRTDSHHDLTTEGFRQVFYTTIELEPDEIRLADVLARHPHIPGTTG